MFEDYECKGQMNIFDFIDNQKTEKVDKPKIIGFCHATNHDCNNLERQKVAFDIGVSGCKGGCCVPCEYKTECGARCGNWNYGNEGV